jgi:hypothetical protein
MPRVGFEPTIPMFELARTVHALDRAATVIGLEVSNHLECTASRKTSHYNCVAHSHAK